MGNVYASLADVIFWDFFVLFVTHDVLNRVILCLWCLLLCKPSNGLSPLTLSSGSEECSFPFPPDVRKDWSPDSPVICTLRPIRVHSYTQTEGPQLPSPTADVSRPQPSLLVPVPPTLPSCPSPLPIRKHCAKWENRASVLQKPKEPLEGNKQCYESLESVSAAPTLHRPPCLLFLTKIELIVFTGKPEATKNERNTTQETPRSWARGGVFEETHSPSCRGGLLLLDSLLQRDWCGPHTAECIKILFIGHGRLEHLMT